METSELNFELPPELIAQTPAARRSDSRLLHYRREDQSVAHRRFSDLPDILRPGDLLLFNNSRVIPARFMLQKETGGLVEGLFLSEPRQGEWIVFLKNAGQSKDLRLRFADAPQITVQVLENRSGGEFRIGVDTRESALTLLERLGRMPLPPYIKRDKLHDERDALDRERYQTVFAQMVGAVAAPTAALHFTPELLDVLRDKGIGQAFVTLHVGAGTFKPVTTERLEDHPMHEEAYSIDADAAASLNAAKAEGRRIVAIGTTSARVLESQPADRPFEARSDKTRIFIYPPYRWKHVGALVTNFHLPRSTLIALVAALVGLEEQRNIYRIAIENRYRFFSYGDAMFIE